MRLIQITITIDTETHCSTEMVVLKNTETRRENNVPRKFLFNHEKIEIAKTLEGISQSYSKELQE